MRRSYEHAIVYRGVEVLGSMHTESVYESSTSDELRNDNSVGHRTRGLAYGSIAKAAEMLGRGACGR